MRTFVGLILSFILTFSAAFAGSRFMPGVWYENLTKPSWNPPNAVFAPVWTVLYIMMAFSLWIIWKSRPLNEVKIPVILFIIQLILNATWTYLFFGLKNPGLAFGEIIVLWVFIAATIYSFFRMEIIAALLLVPYIVWVTFASYLNYTIWRLNS